MRLLTFTLGALLAVTPAALQSVAATENDAAPGTETIRIYSTASTKAELHDCGCKKKPMGGLARRAALLEKNDMPASNTLLVDAGDWAEEKGEYPWEKTQLIWGIMADMGYEAVTPGARELLHGRSALEGLYASRPEVAVVSANITDKSGTRIWQEFTTVNKGAQRIAITGVTGSAPYVFNLTRGNQVSDDFGFGDPTETLLQVVPRMKEASDVVVVLCNTSPADARRIVDEVPGIDVLVVGYNPGYQFNPDRLGNTLLVRSGGQGKYLNQLDLVMDGKGIVDYNGEAIPVNKRLPEQPEFAQRVTDWETKFEVASR